MVVAAASAAPALDQVIFGDPASENEHGLVAEYSAVATGPSGTLLAQPHRVFQPRETESIYGGSATFTLAVHPTRRTYFSAKLWGGDDARGDLSKGRLYVYVLLDGVEYQIGYRHEGDHQANLTDDSYGPSLPGRFFYSTVLLPLWMTQGRESLTFRIIASGRIYALGAGYEGDGGNYQFTMKAPSRGIYRAYTHIEPRLDPVGEVQGTEPVTTPRPALSATSQLGSNSAYFASVRGQINNRLNTAPSLASSNFTPGGVEFLACSYHVDGRIDPFQVALPGYLNPAVPLRVRELIDLHATDYAANPGRVDDDWGGLYGPIGYAIQRLSAELAPELDTLVDFGAGGTRLRRHGWADMLHASREFGRYNRDGRALTNQGMLADQNIYKANLGLRALGDPRAWPEAEALRYLHEAAGLRPWLGSDLPGGGSSRPYGDDYFQVTPKGLTREWGYVGTNYGELQSYVARFHRLSGDPALRDQAALMLRARAAFRRPAVEPAGLLHHPRMAAIGYLAWRGAGESDGNGFGGESAYGDRTGALAGMLTAATTLDPLAIGYAKQMLADGQFFPSLTQGGYATLNALDVFADYAVVARATDPGHRLPMGDGRPDFAWADEVNGVVAAQKGSERLWIAPYWQAKAGTGINGVARFHYTNGVWDQIGTMETTPLFDFSGRFFVRPNRVDKPEADLYVPPAPPRNAYAGEKLPLGNSPPGASRDDPFRGRPDFYAFRFGRFLFGLNLSAERTRDLRTPRDFVSATDLVTGASKSGSTIAVPPRSTVVLALDAVSDAAPAPATPAWLELALSTEGPELTWAPASGATGYTIRRSTSPEGPFDVIAVAATGTTFVDTNTFPGLTYHYTVTATNSHGESYPSHANSILAGSAAAVLSINLAPTSGATMVESDRAGAPGVRATRWNNFSGGTIESGLLDAAGRPVTGVTATLTNGNSGGFSDRGGSLGDEASLFRTVLDKFGGTPATLTVTGIPHANYDVYFYVHPDENTPGANDRGGRFTIGDTTYFVRTGTATRVAGPGDYLRASSTTLGSGMDVELGNYVRFENLSGPLTATFTAVNINGGTQRLKVAGFQIVGRTAPAPGGLAAIPDGPGAIALSWTPVDHPDVSYRIMRAFSAAGPFTIVANQVSGASWRDTGLTAGATYHYTVSSINSAGPGVASQLVSASTPTPLMVWRMSVFGTSANAGEAADAADADGDGLANLLEYALGSSPLSAASRAAPAITLDDAGDGRRLRLDFSRVNDPFLRYAVHAGDELDGPWAEIWHSIGAQNLAGPLSVSDTRPVAASPRRFLRVAVSAAP
ncbi:MAG: fibronectin type III domain-containing protein [Opitutaceae bacterium]|jgi:hypothetical protein|nr:fibronectin type III domain-containing protein [Opitutaceae bacterium]